jgi:23S rRNA pseudouridine2605 synthase
VKKVLGALGLTVNRLIRLSFGPFQLGDLAEREVREIRGRMLRDQLGPRLIEAAGANFDAPLVQRAEEPKPEPKRDRTGRPGQGPQGLGQKPRGKLSRGQAAEDSLERLDTRKAPRGAQRPKAGKPTAGQPKPFGKPDSKRMRGDGAHGEKRPRSDGENRPNTSGSRPTQKTGGRPPQKTQNGGPPQKTPNGGPAGRGRGNADRRR